MSKKIRPRRSVLYMPGANSRALDKARSLPADAIVLDLEDAVAPAAKPRAREQVRAAVSAGGYGHREVVIRVNAYGTEWWHEDLLMAISCGADAMLVPKVESADQVSKFGDLMTINAAPDDMALWIMAETPLSIRNIDAIAVADPRLAAIVMGTSDLATALRLPPDSQRLGLQHALSACILAARSYGIDILDGVHGNLADTDGLSSACAQGKMLGFDGKTLIHPSQIDTANTVFGVSADEIAAAKEVIASWNAATAAGLGIAVVDGQMIENLHADAARRGLALADAIADIGDR